MHFSDLREWDLVEEMGRISRTQEEEFHQILFVFGAAETVHREQREDDGRDEWDDGDREDFVQILPLPVHITDSVRKSFL